MNNSEVLEKLRAYLKCRERQVKGIYYACNNKKCDDCDLCYMQGTIGEHIEAIEVATQALEKLKDNEPCKCDSRTAKVNKAKVDSLEVIARMLDDKLYYELKYRLVGKNDYYIGYSSYDLKIVLGYIDEYFEIVESDKYTNADRIRNMSDEELADWLNNMCDFEKNEEPYKSIYNLDTYEDEEVHESYGDLLNWLQSEAE